MKLSARLLLPVLSVLLLSVIGLTGYSLWSQYELIAAQERERLTDLAHAFTDRLQQKAESATALAAAITSDPDVQSAFAIGDREALLNLVGPTYTTLHSDYAVSQAQFHLAPAISFLRLHKPEKYGDDLSSLRPMLVKALRDRARIAGLENGVAGYGLRGIVPVLKDGAFIGTFEIGFDIDSTLLESFKGTQGGDVSLFIYTPDAEDKPIFTPYISTMTEPHVVADDIRQVVVDTAEPAITQVNLNDEPFSVITYPVQDHAGAIVGVVEISASRAEALGRIQQSLATGLAIASLLLIVTGVFLWQLLARTVINPLKQLTAIAVRLADGDTQVGLRQCTRRDEIGQLTNAFDRTISYLNDAAQLAATVARGDLTADVQPRSAQDTLGIAFARMVTDLRLSLGQVAQAANQVQVASQDLARHTSQVGDATRQIAATVEQVSAGTRQQADGVSRTANSMTQMKGAIEGVAQGAQEQASAMTQASAIAQQINSALSQVAESSQVVSRDSSNAALAARAGMEVVNDTLIGMETIKVKVAGSASKVREMGQRSDEIGAIVELIDDIASQTNLLALNAAIEAARAGEHGRGFAVVADEVRKLAERSSGATKEIGGLVRAIQGSVKDAVIAMDDGSREVEVGAQRAQTAGQSLREIVAAADAVNQQAATTLNATAAMTVASRQLTDSMDSVSAVVEENTAATEQMAAGSIEVTDALQSVAEVGQENGKAVADVAQAAGSIAGEIESVTASATRLAQLAEQMKQVVHQFKLTQSTDAELHEEFETFKRAHVGWVERARSWIAGTEAVPAEIPDHATCALGRWHSGRSALEHGHLPEFQAVEEPHRRFHGQLTRLASSIKAGRATEVRTEVEALARTSQEVVAALERLEAACCAG